VVGSPAIAAWIAHVVFWGLLLYGWAIAALNPKGLVIFLLLWLTARVGLPYVPYGAVAAMFSAFVAMLDIALVLVIFKGDVRLT
jgi:hypothetical protein